MALTSINDRLTPSSPIEITFGAQPKAVGRKFTTIFGHGAAGQVCADYTVKTVVSVGDPKEAQTEVDALAGAGSQIGKMAYAFVAANAFAGRSNFPAFRVVIIPLAETGFGPADEALEAVKLLRNDMLVSCYGASVTTPRGKLIALATMLSGPDRDLSGQFGSHCIFGSLEALSSQVLYAINSKYALVACLPDSNTALVNVTADTTSGSNILTDVSPIAGVYAGAALSGTGIAVGAVVEQVIGNTILMSLNATATGSNIAVAVQNKVSQELEIVAASHAGAQMASAFPYNPLQGVTIGGLVPPQKTSDRIVVDPNGSSESALSAGLSPLYVQAGGTVGFIRTRTTWVLKSDNVTPITAYFDWQDLAVLNDFREICYQVTQNPPFNSNPGGTKASQQNSKLLKDEVLREAQAFEYAGAFQNVKLLAKYFQVSISTTYRGRFDFKIPVDVIPGLYVIAGNIEAVSDLGQFTA